MKKLLPLLLPVLMVGCKNNTSDKPADELAPDEMPAHIQNLYRAADQHPDSTGLRMRLVDALDSIGAYKQAVVQMDSLIAQDSLNYGLWYRKSMVQQEMGDTTGALASLGYAIRVYPAPDALLSAANLLAEKKDAAALNLTDQVFNLRLGREYNAHCFFIKGVYYARTGQQDKALASFDACITEDRNYMEAYMEKGFLYYDNQQVKEAQQVFQTVVAVKNTYADGYYWLAKCLEQSDKPAAITNYRRALQLDPSLKEAKQALDRLGG